MVNLDNQPNEERVEEENIEFEKFSSLVHILKHQEEFWLDSSGVIVGSNLEAVNVTGYEEYEVVGKHISIFYSPDEVNKVWADLNKADKLGQAFVTGLRMKKRGASFWAKMQFIRVNRDHPEKPQYQVLMQDATHRALSNLRVRTLKDEYLAIFNNPFVGTFKFRMSDYRLLMCNQKAREIICQTENETNLCFRDFFQSHQQFDHFMKLLREELRIDGFKFLINDKKSNDNWGVLSARYFDSQEFVEGVIFDISEQHSQMLELKRVTSELDNFVYHASHDLRAPLASILGLVNLGLREDSPETVNSYLQKIGERVTHLDQLLYDLKAVSFNNVSDPSYAYFDFKEELDSIIRSFGTEYPVQVSLDIQQKTDFMTDSARVRTIMRNLLSNAFKYHNPNTRNPSVKLKIKVDVNHAVIQLKDNGIGIEWDLKGRICDMFFRGTKTSTGTGLGLYIVKSMVDKLRGRLSFESTYLHGTTFLLSIPNALMRIESGVSYQQHKNVS